MKTRKILAIFGAVMLVASGISIFGAHRASAIVIYEDPGWGAELLFPGATYSARQNDYHDEGYRITHAHGAEKLLDGFQERVTTNLEETIWMETGGYSMPSHIWSNGDEFILNVAPDNATILWIKVAAMMTVTTGYIPSTPHFMYTFDGWNTIHQSTTPEIETAATISPNVYFYWNVTLDQTWTPALVKSASFHVILWFDGLAGREYDIDYVGILYLWYTAGSWFPVGDEEPSRSSAGPFAISPIGAMGIIGFFGMIAIPAGGIWLARRSDQPRMIFGLQMMVAFVVCLGLFMAAIL